MRGKVVLLSVGWLSFGITPAYAGKRWRVPAKLAASRDHPRVCGEKGPAMPYLLCSSGSPPRMRGKVCTVPLRPLGVGITPAYAGKRVVKTYRHSIIRDHPRVCGEKSGILSKICGSKGSPPRMRGKVASPVRTHIENRITPAYAGKRA